MESMVNLQTYKNKKNKNPFSIMVVDFDGKRYEIYEALPKIVEDSKIKVKYPERPDIEEAFLENNMLLVVVNYEFIPFQIYELQEDIEKSLSDKICTYGNRCLINYFEQTKEEARRLRSLNLNKNSITEEFGENVIHIGSRINGVEGMVGELEESSTDIDF